MIRERWKLTVRSSAGSATARVLKDVCLCRAGPLGHGQPDSISNLRHTGPRISPSAAIQLKALFLVELSCVPVLFQHPQRHLNESTAPKFLQHMIHERPAVAMTAQIRQAVQRRNVANARRRHRANRPGLSHGVLGRADRAMTSSGMMPRYATFHDST